MSSEALAACILVLTLFLALIIDRGIPNLMDSIAFALEFTTGWLIKGLRNNASRLRDRYTRIEQAHQQHLRSALATGPATRPKVPIAPTDIDRAAS
jgi:hypothetical protein